MKENEIEIYIVDSPQRFTEEQLKLVFDKISNETKVWICGEEGTYEIQNGRVVLKEER